jgi:beta-1,2-mannobiose phosphorylase / 1,2-beta-oligomannan phosphorylase
MSIVKFTQHKNNPIMIGDETHSWEACGVFNPATVLYDGKIYILYTAAGEKLKGNGTALHESRIGLAISENGYDITYRHPDPVIEWDLDDEETLGLFGINGVENPRISKLGDIFYIVYTITSDCDDRIALASTEDFKIFKKHGLIADDMSQRCGALFPDMIDGRYWLMHRPLPNLWVSQSDDLKNFNSSRLLLTTSSISWGEKEVGIATPPIKTNNAWAVIFFGKDKNDVCRLGILWLDLKNPFKVLKIYQEPILTPEATVDILNQNGIYACGTIIKDKIVYLYYGIGESVACVATMSQEMLKLPIK